MTKARPNSIQGSPTLHLATVHKNLIATRRLGASVPQPNCTVNCNGAQHSKHRIDYATHACENPW